MPGHDGVSDPDQGGESQGGPWKGNNDKPAHPDEKVVTRVVRETSPVVDRDPSHPDEQPG